MKTREERLGNGELPRRTITLRGWGDTIITTLGALDKDRFEQDWKRLKDSRGQREDDHAGFRAFTVIRTVINEDGSRLFNDEDFDQLCKQPADIVSVAFDMACELNALTKADREALVKN